MDAQEVNGNELSEYQPDQYGGATDTGPRRSENQDAFWIPDQNAPADLGGLYLVADGVGGQQDGAVASKLAVETVRHLYFDLRRQGRLIPIALKNAMDQANLTILEDAQKRDVRKMGSTFVAAVVDSNKLIVAHVGDARAYLIRRGEIKRLTRDDSWVQKQVDAGLITEEEAANHEFRNVVTQVLGNKPEINVNISQAHELQSGDIILLCSDGLYDVLPDSRMIALATNNAPQSAAKLLVEAAIDAEATDNITAVIIRSGQFVPLADEPTLVPPPIPIESAPTMIVPPTSAPAALPPTKDKGGIPKWLIILAVFAVILIAGALLTFWLQNRNVTEDSKDAAATAMPAIVESPTSESGGALRALDPTSTVESPAETSEPLATATSRPPDTPTPIPTPTLEATSDEATSEPRGCAIVEPIPFVRTDEQFNAGCSTAFMRLEAGNEVRILSDSPVAPGGNCGPGQFIKIQSISDPALLGWVHADAIDLINAGESCNP